MHSIKTIISKLSRLLAFVAIAVLAGFTISYAGSLIPPGSPEKTMYSLEDIYGKLVDFTDTSTEGGGSFATPGSVSATMHSLSDIYDLLADAEDALVPENIAEGIEIFGVEGALEAGSDYDINNPGPFTDNEDGTVTDENTGLVWQDSDYDGGADDYQGYLCWDGGAGCDSGTGETAEGYGAVEYCVNLTYADSSDWRLPTIKEWQTITDYSIFEPAILLPGIASDDYYWSSTEHADYPSDAWGWYSYAGDLGGSNKDRAGRVRCVQE